MATNPWDSDPIVQGGEPQGQSFPRVIEGRPAQPKPKDPYDVATDQRDTISSLRREFRGLPTFEAYDVALGAFNSSLKTAPNAQGDQSLITSYAKMLDPTSAVREGEFATTASTENTLNQVRARLAKEFGFEEGGMLSPEGREFVRKEMWNLVNQRFKPAYERDRGDYTKIAESYGYEPFKVVGSDPFNSYESSINEFLTPPTGQDDEEGLTGIRVTDETPDQSVVKEFERQKNLRGEPGFFDVAKSGLSLGLTDEASGVGQVIGKALQGDFDVAKNYNLGRDAEQMRIDAAREKMGPVLSLATEALGGGAGILSKGGQVIRAGRAAAQAGNLSKEGVRQQLVKQATREGAKVGSVGGFGYGEGFEGSTSNALIGTLGGAVVGRYGQKAGNALAARGEASSFNPTRAREVARAGEAEGVTVNRAMIDPRQQNTFSGVEATRFGGPRINRQMDEIEGQVESRVSAIGGDRTPQQEAMGVKAQEAANRRQGSARDRAGVLYEKADKVAGGVSVSPAKAVAEIDKHIAELQAAGANSNRGQIQYLQDVREDISNGISIRGLRDQRTNMRGQINERNLGKTDAERRIGEVLDAASDDIDGALANNPAAKKIYREADKIWRERAEFRRQIERDIIGLADNPKSGTQAARKLESWMRDDAPRFKRLWDSMDDAEQSEVRGYVANALGRNAKGEFSPAIFLNNLWAGKTRIISERTARTVFGDEGVQSLKNLKILSEEINRLNALRNSSNTARGNNYRNWMFEALGLLGGGGAGLVAGGGGTAVATAAGGAAAAAGAKAARDIINAKMLMNPKISKWILSAPRTTDAKAIDAHFNRLVNIAKAEPALQAEIDGLRQTIMRAANDNAASSLVAENQVPEE